MMNSRLVLEHDALGRVVSQTDADGETRWRWDDAPHGIGRLAGVRSPDGHEVSYGYDAFGRPQTTQLSLDGETFASSIAYDAFDRPETITYPQGDGVAPFAIRREYDPHGHLLAVRDAATNAPYWRLWDTDSAGRTLAEVLGTQITTTRAYFEDKNRVRRIGTTAGAAPLQDLSYIYDDRLNLVRRTDDLQGKSEYFDYDDLDRLTCARFHLVPGCSETYDYHPNGNLASKPGLGAFTYDPDHPHAVGSVGADSYHYDAVGNQIARPGADIDYTAFDLPKTLTLSQVGPVELDYDGNQRRIRKTAPDRVTVYVDDLYERVTDVATGAVEHRYYVHSPERVVAIVTQSAGAAAATSYVHVDHLGSLDVVTDPSGNELERRSYDAFGARRNPIWGAPTPASFPAGATPGFTGHVGDEDLGLVHMKGRMYDPRLGRFLTPDPIIAAPHFSQSWNPYSYVLNNPLAYVDPSGFQQEPPAAMLPIRTEEIRGAGGQLEEVRLFYSPRKTEEPRKEDPRESAAQAGDIVTPTDVGVTGNVAGFIPEPPLSDAERLDIDISAAGSGALDAAEDIGLSFARSLVLNVLTFGGYGTYETGAAILAGYAEDGVLGALNKVNPLYQIAKGAVDTNRAAERGDYRAAGAEAMTTTVLVVATVAAVAGGAAALTEAAAARAAARGVARGAARVANLRVCFPAGTLVATPNGQRPIESVQEGDAVYAWDFDTGELVVRSVSATFERTSTELVRVIIDNEEYVEVTESHPFWVSGKGWTNAADLQVGMKLLGLDGTEKSITEIGGRSGAFAVYNFEVAGEHNYFVGADSVLVHNLDVVQTDFNRATNEALGWLRTQGVDTSKVSGPFNARFGSHKGNPIGVRFEGGGYYRIEFDARSGAHINVGVGKTKGPHIQFEGGQKTVDTLIRRLFRC